MSLCVWQNERLLEIANDPVPQRILDRGLITLGPGGGLHDDADRLRLLRDRAGAADHPLPAIRLRAARVLGCRAADADAAVCCSHRSCSSGASLFAFFVVLPPAVDFLVDFNSDQFNNQLRARDYYTFFATMLIAMGLIFELPLAILAVTRLGIVTPDQLAAEPPLRGPRDRRRCGTPAEHRPGDADPRDRADPDPLRSEYLARPRLRAARLRAVRAVHPGALGNGQGTRAPNGLRHTRPPQAGGPGRLHDPRRVDGAEPVHGRSEPVSFGDVFGGGSGGEASEVSLDRAEELEKQLAKDPQNESLLLQLTRERIAAGNNLVQFDEATGQPLPTVESQAQYEQAADAWARYLKVAEEPNPNTAQLTANALFTLASTSTTAATADANYEDAAAAQRVVAAARPSLGTLSTLAYYSYAALRVRAGRQGDQAGGRGGEEQIRGQQHREAAGGDPQAGQALREAAARLPGGRRPGGAGAGQPARRPLRRRQRSRRPQASAAP